MTSAPGVEIRIAFLICYLQSLYEIELGHYFCPEFVGHVISPNILVDVGKLMYTNTVMAIRCMRMEIIFKLWVTTAGNLSVEIRYQKLKVNFNYCFRHGIFQNQVYNFFCIISWVVLHSSLFFFSSRFFNSKICLFFFSEFLVIWMFVKNSNFALQILEK